MSEEDLWRVTGPDEDGESVVEALMPSGSWHVVAVCSDLNTALSIHRKLSGADEIAELRARLVVARQQLADYKGTMPKGHEEMLRRAQEAERLLSDARAMAEKLRDEASYIAELRFSWEIEK
jgi:hypothetical protein